MSARPQFDAEFIERRLAEHRARQAEHERQALCAVVAEVELALWLERFELGAHGCSRMRLCPRGKELAENRQSKRP